VLSLRVSAIPKGKGQRTVNSHLSLLPFSSHSSVPLVQSNRKEVFLISFFDTVSGHWFVKKLMMFNDLSR
tara:strand:+ start:65 stop:274 length:210 start_codon:yes stop_codon:yes gene_type:complete